MLGLWNDKSRQSADVKRLAQQHIDELDRRIESMLEMAATLKALIRCCAGDERPDCPILHTLEQPDISDNKPEARTGAVPRRAPTQQEKAVCALSSQERYAQNHRLAPS